MAGFNKGQQALEYLITYGWAIVVVLLTIGIFAYLGFLNPDRYLPERCSFGEQLQCVDFLFSAEGTDAGSVWLKFSNNFGEDIRITGLSTVDGYGVFCSDTGGSIDCPTADYVIIPSGEENADSIILNLSEDPSNTLYELFDGEKTLIPMNISFQRDAAAAPAHYIIGEVFAAAQD